MKLSKEGLIEMIKESVKRELTKISLRESNMEGPTMVTVQVGDHIIRMTDKQYKKYKRDQIKKQQLQNGGNKGGRKKPVLTIGDTGEEVAPSQLRGKIAKMLKAAAPLDSLATFWQHAYRSYGNIAYDVMERFDAEYNRFGACYRRIKERLEKIGKWGAKDEYAVYDEARKLSYDVDELSNAIFTLANKIKPFKKEIKAKYGNTPFYTGRMSKDQSSKKELGFCDQLFCKSNQSITHTLANLVSAANEIAEIADMGRNPLSYEV